MRGEEGYLEIVLRVEATTVRNEYPMAGQEMIGIEGGSAQI